MARFYSPYSEGKNDWKLMQEKKAETARERKELAEHNQKIAERKIAKDAEKKK